MSAMSKGATTREAILDKALALASTGGLDGLSIGELAREVGLSKSGLFAHFGSKEDLQIAILRTAVARFIAEVVSPALRKPRGEPRVRALFESWVVWEQATFLPGGCPFLAVSCELDDRPGPVRDFLVQSQRDWLDTIATAVRIAIGEGHFAKDVDPEQFAYELYSLILAYHQFRRLLRDPRTDERCRLAFEQLLERSRSVA
ncbi:MAG TPA: TetR/AcrR family transcriptional regulator [Thermoanaerobaculia bacterium]|jgi:AcrR family transcriptional regulator|nr:TetR/AcrR family transcriptional regulator [Thermoanaerobaculia bacterium]